jgi:sec-independent protein translocase protein TatB
MVQPQTIEVASLGFENSLILMVLALVVFGPRRLPEIGRQIGRLMYEIRKASNDFKFQMEEELRKSEDAERQKKESERLAALALAAPAQTGVDSQIPSAGAEASSLESQIPKWEPGAPVPDGQSPIPSPYSEEGNYPPVSPAEYQEQAPRIQPPSTGESVPASKPGSAAQSTDAVIPEAPDQPNSITEQANHG